MSPAPWRFASAGEIVTAPSRGGDDGHALLRRARCRREYVADRELVACGDRDHVVAPAAAVVPSVVVSVDFT